ncbi:MAG TPA: hypothetical protein VFT53_03075 [Candidatus Saccharimonadales bacterium]|nr:hypothetical protein [Candidatus Saccharimonadales bacterium]
MASFSLDIEYRPLRIGFCVRDGSIEDLVEAARLNTLLCGGIYNPVIPVGYASDEALVKLFNVDLLYPVFQNPEFDRFIEQHHYLANSSLGSKFLWSNDNGWVAGDGETRLRVLDISRQMERHAKASNRRAIIRPEWADDDPLAAVFALSYGDFSRAPRNYDVLTTFPKPFYKIPLKINSHNEIDLALLQNPAPIHMGSFYLDLKASHASWRYDGLYLGDHHSFRDLANFWNLRASGIEIAFIPFAFSEQYKKIAQRCIEWLVRRKQERKSQREGALWYSADVAEEAIHVIAHELGIVEQRGEVLQCRVDDSLWNGFNLRPVTPMITRHSVIANVDNKFGPPRVVIPLPKTPPSVYGWPYSEQHFCASIHLSGEYEYEGYTLQPPHLPDLNEWYGWKILYDNDIFRVSPDGMSFIVNTGESFERLYPLEYTELIAEIFKRSGIATKASQAGIIANHLIKQMGGLDGCRVFKIPGVRKLINPPKGTQNTDTISRGEAQSIITDKDPLTKTRTFDAHKSLTIQAREKPDLTPEDAFSYLVEKRLFRPGIELRCPSCGLHQWIGIKDVKEKQSCEYCEAGIDLMSQFKNSAIWEFRKSGLIAKKNNQEGAIPVALTLWRFLHATHNHNLIYSTALNLTGSGIECETDLVILDTHYGGGVLRKGGVPAIVLGEVKSNADEIDDKDLENLMKTKSLLEAKNVRVFLAFARTSDFTSEEIRRFKELVSKGIRPILFTHKELEPYDLYAHYRNKGTPLPRAHVSSFEDLAINSEAIYLF